jgi:hypothetical protein
MIKPMRAALMLLLPLSISTAALAATPFDTPGPFVEYAFDSGAYNTNRHFVTGNAWVNDAGVSPPAGQVAITARGDTGVAKIGWSGTGSFSAGGWSGWNDTITIMPAAGVTAAQGTLTFQLHYDWNAQISGAGTATAFVDVNLISGPTSQYALVEEDITHSCSQAGQCGNMWAFGQGTTTPTFADGVASFSFTVTFGQPLQLVIGMNLGIQGENATVIADATHSLYWGGIRSVTVGAQQVAYQATSVSGMDYNVSAVPEVSAASLLLIGLLALAGYSGYRSRYAQI